MTDNIKIAVMLTSSDIEILLMALKQAMQPHPYYLGDKQWKERDEMLERLVHARKALMDAER